MGTSCSDVCELVQEMLNGLGFKFDDNEASHDDMLQALNQCVLVKDGDLAQGKAKLVIFVQGGLIQEIIADQTCRYLIIDKDIENYEEDELAEMTEPNGDAFQAALNESAAGEDIAEPDKVEHYWNQIPAA